MIDLLKLEAPEAERLAYAEGFPMAAQLFARIAGLEAELDALKSALDDARDESLERWERYHGPADAYKEFFFDCFARLNRHYPCPEVSSDYDKLVIFEAIEKGDGV